MERALLVKTRLPLLKNGKLWSSHVSRNSALARLTFRNRMTRRCVMTFYINAWLDRADPFISLHNRHTDEVVARFDRHELQACLDQGDFCLQELCDPCQRAQQELVKCLLLAQCARNARCQVEGLFGECSDNCRRFSRSQQLQRAEVLLFRRSDSPAAAFDMPQPV